MKNYFIHWEQKSAETLTNAQNVHFFAIEHEGRVLYLGLAYKLSLAEEVKETLKLFRLNPKEVKVWTGQIIRNIQNVVNQQIAEEILCLMVFETKPELNVICKRSYYGRDGLEIFNRGMSMLPAHLKAGERVMKASTTVFRMTGTGGF